jgi:hypothetical protein
MALIFPRIAQNFIRNGYFPTDVETLDRVATFLELDAAGPIRLLDPCCGEGAAMAHLVERLRETGPVPLESFGIEIDEDRAWHAKSVLGTVAHADVHDVRVADRSMGLLFLNPPYGDLVSDGARTGDQKHGRERHEKVFCLRTFNLLQPGGVLVLIVPFYVLDQELSTLIARHFERVEVFMSPEQQFKQCVLFGVKRRPGYPDAKLVQRLVAFAAGADQLELPEYWCGKPYVLPVASHEEFTFTIVRLDAKQLQSELDAGLRQASLWPRCGLLLKRQGQRVRPPLRAMTDWHLALALAAGQICGVVESAAGVRLLIKGRTTKTKSTQIVHETSSDGSIAETRILTDRFVTVIRALDLTPGAGFGDIVTIL